MMFKLFDSMKTKESFSENATMFLLFLIIVVVLQLLLGKYLWNSFLVKLFPGVKPARDVLDILAISILFRLLIC